MRRIAAVATVLILAASRLAAAESVGVRQIEVSTPERDTATHVSLWYPNAAGGDEVLVGENAVFRGVSAVPKAPIAEGRFPLVLISHGGFRAAPHVANWLAAALVTKGFAAAVVIPPAIPNGQATQPVLSEFWLRPADFSAAIAALENDTALARRIDLSAIGGVGFFLGGHAVLRLAGAQIDFAAFARACEGEHRTRDCIWFAKGGVDLRHVDSVRLSQSAYDRRLKAAIVIDPEFTGTLAVESLRSISVPIDVVTLGPPPAIASAEDPESIASSIPGAKHARIVDAGLFSSFPECKPDGIAILKKDGESEVCEDGDGRPRADIHAQLVTMIEAALRKSLFAR